MIGDEAGLQLGMKRQKKMMDTNRGHLTGNMRVKWLGFAIVCTGVTAKEDQS